MTITLVNATGYPTSYYYYETTSESEVPSSDESGLPVLTPGQPATLKTSTTYLWLFDNVHQHKYWVNLFKMQSTYKFTDFTLVLGDDVTDTNVRSYIYGTIPLGSSLPNTMYMVMGNTATFATDTGSGLQQVYPDDSIVKVLPIDSAAVSGSSSLFGWILLIIVAIIIIAAIIGTLVWFKYYKK